MFFKRRPSTPQQSRPEPRFGRYTDAWKNERQLEAWALAVEAFQQQRFPDACQGLFEYLRDEHEDNLTLNTDTPPFRFTLRQGSRLIEGSYSSSHFSAAADIAHVRTSPSQELLRELLEHNDKLHFSAFSLHEDNRIRLRFGSSHKDCSPHKLYHALKELALTADESDDHLLLHYPELSSLAASHVQPLPAEEVALRLRYLRKWVAQASALIPDSPEERYLHLWPMLAYKIDYLLAPEGFTRELISRIDYRSHADDPEGHSRAAAEFTRLANLTDAFLGQGFYTVRATFGVSKPVLHDQLIRFLFEVTGDIRDFQREGQTELALATSDYAAGYCLYHFAAPRMVHELLHAYWQIREPDFFRELGQTPPRPREAMQKILRAHHEHYPRLNTDLSRLDFSTPERFALSFPAWLRDLNLVEPNA